MGDEAHYFDSKSEAVSWVRTAQARGETSIDIGCMQVNLQFHPQAFASIEEAFDTARNADYAARFLVALKARSGNWAEATGDYHSHTPALAAPYRAQVAQAMAGVGHGRAGDVLQPPRRQPLLAVLSAAWSATIVPDTESRMTGVGAGNRLVGQDWSVLLHPRRNRQTVMAAR